MMECEGGSEAKRAKLESNNEQFGKVELTRGRCGSGQAWSISQLLNDEDEFAPTVVMPEPLIEEEEKSGCENEDTMFTIQESVPLEVTDVPGDDSSDEVDGVAELVLPPTPPLSQPMSATESSDVSLPSSPPSQPSVGGEEARERERESQPAAVEEHIVQLLDTVSPSPPSLPPVPVDIVEGVEKNASIHPFPPPLSLREQLLARRRAARQEEAHDTPVRHIADKQGGMYLVMWDRPDVLDESKWLKRSRLGECKELVSYADARALLREAILERRDWCDERHDTLARKLYCTTPDWEASIRSGDGADPNWRRALWEWRLSGVCEARSEAPLYVLDLFHPPAQLPDEFEFSSDVSMSDDARAQLERQAKRDKKKRKARGRGKPVDLSAYRLPVGPSPFADDSTASEAQRIEWLRRVSELPRSVSLALFRDPIKGWTVRCAVEGGLDKGVYVTHMTGQVRTNAELSQTGDRTYCLEIPNGGGGKPIAIDCTRVGNEARFFSHACQANMDTINVPSLTYGLNLPAVCFVTNRRVEYGEELTIDYNPNKCKHTSVACWCTVDCRNFIG